MIIRKCQFLRFKSGTEVNADTVMCEQAEVRFILIRFTHSVLNRKSNQNFGSWDFHGQWAITIVHGKKGLR